MVDSTVSPLESISVAPLEGILAALLVVPQSGMVWVAPHKGFEKDHLGCAGRLELCQ